MSPPHTMRLACRADWALMAAVHDALRRDLDQLLHGTASHASARTRWASPGVREQVLSQLPAPARLLYRTVCLPRYARTTPAL